MPAENSTWFNIGTLAAIATAFAAGWLVRLSEFVRLGKASGKEKELSAALIHAEADKHLADAKTELTRELQNLIAVKDEERSQMRERIAVLESTAKTFKEQYDSQVIKMQDLIAEVARLSEENTQLKRRLKGALRPRGTESSEGNSQ